MDSTQRRKTDSWYFQLSRLAAIIVALGILLGALATVGSTVFVKKEEVKILDTRVNIVEKDQVRVITKLDDIATSIREIKEAVKAKKREM